MKKIKIVFTLYIVITLMALFITTNSDIIVEQRLWILMATYIIGFIAGLFGAFVCYTDITNE